MARRMVAVAFVVFASILVNLAYQPDVGTAADLHSAGLTDPIVGRNHTNPLPRVETVTDIVRAVAFALVLLLVLTALHAGFTVLVARGEDRRPSLLWSRVHARRGPPAPAVS